MRRVNPKLTSFEASCFDGHYITGDITTDYLRSIEIRRDARRDSGDDEGAAAGPESGCLIYNSFFAPI